MRRYFYVFLSGVLFTTCQRPQPDVARIPAPVKTRPTASAPAKPVTPPEILRPLASADSLDAPAPEYTTPVPSPKHEFRAVWIATVENIDWPSKKGLSSAEQQTEFTYLLDYYRQTNFNAVVVQVRAAADAFYAKSSEPWSEWLTGQQGRAPEPFYDPMAFMIDETHQRGMEFHAWLNLDRGTFSPKSVITADHVSRQHPEWFLTYGGRKLFNLGLPDVRAYVAGVTANIVREYDVDGIHFDDYFYPYAIEGQVLRDDEAYRQHYNGMAKNDWRRDNVDKLILQLRDSIRAVKPFVKFGISPFGVWKNQKADPDGSPTNGGQSFYDLYADTRKWAQKGWIDYIVPQIYFTTEFERVPYRTMVDWWQGNCGRAHLYIGHGAYRVGNPRERDAAWRDPTQMATQVRYNRQVSETASLSNKQPVLGSVYFSAKSLVNNPLGVRDSLQTGAYRLPALVPPMFWIDSLPPLPVQNLTLTAVTGGKTLTWQSAQAAVDGDTARCFAIYRVEGRRATVNVADPRNLLTVSPWNRVVTQFTDRTADPKKRYTYAVTALDRLNNESRAAVVRTRL